MNKGKEDHVCVHCSTIPNHLCERRETKPESWQWWETSLKRSCQASQTTKGKKWGKAAARTEYLHPQYHWQCGCWHMASAAVPTRFQVQLYLTEGGQAGETNCKVLLFIWHEAATASAPVVPGGRLHAKNECSTSSDARANAAEASYLKVTRHQCKYQIFFIFTHRHQFNREVKHGD